MKHRLVALVALALLLAAVVIGNATAAPPPLTPAQAQAMGQDAASGQRADTTAGSGQYQPSNQSVPTRIGSSGGGGDVTQTNVSAAAAISKNENATDQSAAQTQAGGSGGSYGQAAGQSADSEQTAKSDADSTQVKPSNVNVPIRIGSKGDSGDVTQTNASVAAAASANGNETGQTVEQSQSGSGSKDAKCCSDASYSQAAGQEAKNEQKADSEADSTQKAPSNINVPIRILSPGNDGDVTQTNASIAAAASANGNETAQTVEQDQSGSGSKDGKCGCSDASYSQAAGQSADNEQKAKSDADSKQIGASNVNVPIRIGSKGHGGDVTQTNASLAAAISANGNHTNQTTKQTQGGGTPAYTDSKHDPKCGCSSDALYDQASGQESKNDQWADSDADSKQVKPSNVNAPVRIDSKGHDGDVTQTNLSAALAASLNGNSTDQTTEQTQSGSGSGGVLAIQAAGQESKSEQGARSDADSTQYGASNTNAPVRIDSKGGGGDVTQTNASLAAAISANGNHTEQTVGQSQGGGVMAARDPRCGCSDDLLVQAVGQSAKNDQWADSDADSTQKKASNTNAPVRIDSKGHDGDVTQTNASLAAAISANGNATGQSVGQRQAGGSGGIAVQAAGQESKSEQGAKSDADSKQDGASNTAVPVRIDSKGGGGDVTQTNLSAALGASLNGNSTRQSLDQTQSGGRAYDPWCGCSDALYIQAAGQESHNDQWADSDAESSQHGASNLWDPVRVDSKGRDGNVSQLNASLDAAIAANGNATGNHATQTQSGSGSSYQQDLGQSAGNRQKAGSGSRSKQGKAKSKREAPSHKRGGRHLVD